MASTWLRICIVWCATAMVVRPLPHGCKWLPRVSGIDIRAAYGVQTDKIPGSRVEYHPFPSNYRIHPGHTLQFEFRTTSPSGLIFLAGDFDMADMVSAYLGKGHLTFARRCGSGRAFEIYQERLDDGLWHTLTFNHTENGGRLLVDGRNAFRQYHLGPCVSFSSVLFGGLTGKISTAGSGANHVESQSETIRESEIAQHRFSGCLRNLRFDGKIPIIPPKYHAVSQCDP